jgi:hypothetical protein
LAREFVGEEGRSEASWVKVPADQRIKAKAWRVLESVVSCSRDDPFNGPETITVKCLIVYHANGQWLGEEVSWKRSGSGTYRETTRIEIPQSKAEIEEFAALNRYVIEWRGLIPTEAAMATGRA